MSNINFTTDKKMLPLSVLQQKNKFIHKIMAYMVHTYMHLYVEKTDLNLSKEAQKYRRECYRSKYSQFQDTDICMQ